jgi:hypothetical protein
MICADSSSFIAFIKGESAHDVELVADALAHHLLVFPPVCVTELLSDPKLSPALQASILQIPRLEITHGYWERAGRLRALLVQHRYRPKTADALIAQSCLDHHVPLVTRDQDFWVFQKYVNLRLL